MNMALELMQEVAKGDLESCREAIINDDKAKALESIERAFAKLDTAIDELRNMPGAQPLVTFPSP